MDSEAYLIENIQTLESIFFAKEHRETLDKLLREIAEVDRKVEAASKQSLEETWKALNAGIVPPLDDVKRSLSEKPSPMSQMFLEAALPTEMEVEAAVVAAGSGAKTESAHAVVKFFLQALIGQPLGPVDEKIMEHLEKIESHTLPEPDYGFQITFTFGPGAKKFFKNDALTVTIKSDGAEAGSTDFASSGVKGIFGTPIQWTPPEANPTIMRVEVPPTEVFGKKKDRDGKPKKVAKQFVEVKQDSIFRIFEDVDFSQPLGQGKTPEEDLELEMEMERRGKLVVGLIRFHQLNAGLPILSLKRLTPDEDDVHGGQDELFEGMSEDEVEDGEFGGDEEEEEEEEEDVAPPLKKSAKSQGGSSKPAKPQPECKQQ